MAAATAERDGIQANLLDLDGSFGNRMLAGAATDRGVEAALGGGRRRPGHLVGSLHRLCGGRGQGRRTAGTARRRIGGRGTGPDHHHAERAVGGARRRSAAGAGVISPKPGPDRAHPPRRWREMRRAFASVTEVAAAAESVWNETADGLSEIGAMLAAANEQAAGLGDDELTSALATAGAELGRLREVLNSDPLALWQGGRVDIARLERLRDAGAAGRGASRRPRRVARGHAAADLCGCGGRRRRCGRLGGRRCRPGPGIGEDRRRRPAAAASRGRRLGHAAGRAGQRSRPRDGGPGWRQSWTPSRRRRPLPCSGTGTAERSAAALLGRRDELRGLLDAYQAKAARLGAAEDTELTARYQRARDLLWTAPCDLAAAAAAVTYYQQAILALNGRRQPR